MPLSPDPAPLGLALVGLDQSRQAPTRSLVASAVSLGFSMLQLDVSASDLRPRDLDRSARRDLAAMLRRSGATSSGLDLWIPPTHFTKAEQQDRALGATRSALELAADLTALGAMPLAVVSIELPEQPPEAVLADLRDACQRFGASIADHTIRESDLATQGLGFGLDPAAALAAGQDPAALAVSLRPVSARLSDLASSGRVAPLIEAGRLDALAYKVALETGGYHTAPILDLRSVKEPRAKAPAVAQAWGRLMPGSQ